MFSTRPPDSRSTGSDLIPSDRDLAGAEVELVALPERERRLRSALEPVLADFDYIFLDCPPSLGLLTVNALAAADAVLVPIQCEYYALEGLEPTAGDHRSRARPPQSGAAPRRRADDDVRCPHDLVRRTSLREVRRHLGDRCSTRSSRAACGSPKLPATAGQWSAYSPESRGALAYHEVALEITGQRAPTVERSGAGDGGQQDDDRHASSRARASAAASPRSSRNARRSRPREICHLRRSRATLISRARRFDQNGTQELAASIGRTRRAAADARQSRIAAGSAHRRRTATARGPDGRPRAHARRRASAPTSAQQLAWHSSRTCSAPTSTRSRRHAHSAS